MSPRADRARLPRRPSVVYLIGAGCITALYVLLAIPLQAANDYPTSGPLALDKPAMAEGSRLVDGGPTAKQITELEIDEYGACHGDTTWHVVGGEVFGRPYFAIYDVSAGDVCAVTVRNGGDGSEPSVTYAARVAKAGGAWRWYGPVKTWTDVAAGGAAVLAGLVAGGFLARRGWFLAALDSGARWGRWRAIALVGTLGLILFFIAVDILFAPDLLGMMILLMLVLAWGWGCLGGTWLLSQVGQSEREPQRAPRRKPMSRRTNWLPRRRTRPVGATERTQQDAVASPVVPRFRVTPTSELPHFGNVGGLTEVKQHLEESVGLLLAFADEAAEFQITYNGILLHGPPGTGKTFLAKAVAGEFGLSFIHVTAADLVSKYVGETARNVESAFTTAAAHVPCVLFFDEFDAIGARRDDDASAEDRRAVAQLLTSLERHRSLRDLVVVAATNDLPRLDPAAVRPGRFDRHVRVDLPDAEGRESILQTCLTGRPTDEHMDLTHVVRLTKGMSAAGIASLVEAASLSAFRETVTRGRPTLIGTTTLLAALEARGGRDRPTVEDWSWDRIVLPPDVLAELQQVQRLVEDPERAYAYGVRPPSGMLLAGPPGTGKTTIARILAAQARCSFYPVTVADLTSKWVGESEDTIARLFARARENAPSIIFLDEIDAVASRRGTQSPGHESRLLNQLLAEIDGVGRQAGVFVLAATNRPELLDPALTRGGRLSRHLTVRLPELPARTTLLELHASSMPLGHDVDLGAIAARTEGWSGADLKALCQQAALVAMTANTATGFDNVRPLVVHEHFVEALDSLSQARSSVPAASLTHRDHVTPPPGLGGS